MIASELNSFYVTRTMIEEYKSLKKLKKICLRTLFLKQKIPATLLIASEKLLKIGEQFLYEDIK